MTLNLGELADKIYDLQAEVDKIEAKTKAKTAPLKEQIKDLEQQLQLAMQDVGTDVVSGKKSKADIKESLRVNFQDAEEFFKFAIRRKALHMFERRISITAYREMKEILGGKPIPGLSEFQQAKLNVKKL